MISNRSTKPRLLTMILQKIEDGILTGLLLIMILMAVLQIFLRNFFESGILWGDELVRVLVLWIGLIGAMIASRNNHHISIDIITRYLPERIKPWTSLLTALFTTIVCTTMTWFSTAFVLLEKQDGLIAFAAVPAWVCESIIPISFAIISLRYLILSFHILAQLMKPADS